MSEQPNGRFHLSHTIDLTGILALVALFVAEIVAFGSGYWAVSSAQIKLDAKFDLLDQRLKNDEAITADMRETAKAFAAEQRSGLSQISQSLADLRTLVASQNNDRRR